MFGDTFLKVCKVILLKTSKKCAEIIYYLARIVIVDLRSVIGD